MASILCDVGTSLLAGVLATTRDATREVPVVGSGHSWDRSVLPVDSRGGMIGVDTVVYSLDD